MATDDNEMIAVRKGSHCVWSAGEELLRGFNDAGYTTVIQPMCSGQSLRFQGQKKDPSRQ